MALDGISALGPPEGLFRLVVEAAPAGMVLIDRAGTIVLANTQTETLFGYLREELIGKRVEMLVPERFRGKHQDYRASYCANPEARVMGAGRDLYGLRKDGSEVPVEIGLTPIRTEEGWFVLAGIIDISERKRLENSLNKARAELELRIQERTVQLKAQQLAALNLAQDAEQARQFAEETRQVLDRINRDLEREIAERKRAEAALREKEARLRRLSEAGVIGIIVADTRGSILEANDTFLDMVGYSRDELSAGQVRWDEMTPPEYRELDEKAVEQLAHNGVAVPWEKEYRRKDGSRVAVLVGAALLEGSQDQAICFVLDVTERKRAEEMVALQAAELAQSNAELAQFAYVASHDLQEPLRMVASYLELLTARYKGQLDEKADRWIGFAVDAAGRMRQLISDLLELSRVSTRGKPIVATRCAQAFAAAVANLGQAIKESGAAVTHGPLPTVFADGTQLAQLFQNLLGNAIKYRGPQPPQIRTEAVRRADHWLFSVRDNGIGIDPQFHERIFVIFQRLHTRAEYPGTGIGLALCKKIVERHGGRIWVESQLGQGATFYFTIPDRTEVPDDARQTLQER